jgi:hypothetical protein
MIVVRFPNVLTRNFDGECDFIPSWLSDLFIDESNEEGYDILETIRDAIFAILLENHYSSIYNLTVSEYQNDMLSLHFQVPRYNIDQDSMEYDDRPISYYGVIRYGQMEGNTEDYIL